MDVKELRIGNWIESREKDNWGVEYVFNAIVSDINQYRFGAMVYTHHGSGTVFSDHDENQCYDGTPITEEWLLKFRFEKGLLQTNYDDAVSYLINKSDTVADFIIVFEKGKYYLGIDGEYGVESIFKNLEFVHQLQNLYFALTGEELTIKEPVA
jgi:hypothetical protein